MPTSPNPLPHVEWQRLLFSENLQGEDPEDTALLKEMHAKAESFLSSFSWCKRIVQSFFGCGVGGICAIFLFQIEPAGDGVDAWLWTVVGDLPPAYLVTDVAATPSAALKAYIIEMRRWVAAIQNKDPLDDVMPVNALPTLANAANLATRLTTLEELGICL